MYATHSDLPQTALGNTTELLQARLSDAVDLSGRLKQAYWSMIGVRSSERREMLEAVHDDVDACIDVLSGRIAALSGVAERTIRATAIESSLGQYPLQVRAGEPHQKTVRKLLARFGKKVRANIEQASTLGDVGTVDVLSLIARKVETQLWSPTPASCDGRQSFPIDPDHASFGQTETEWTKTLGKAAAILRTQAKGSHRARRARGGDNDLIKAIIAPVSPLIVRAGGVNVIA